MKPLSQRLREFKLARANAALYRTEFLQPGWRVGRHPYLSGSPGTIGTGGEGNRVPDSPNHYCGCETPTFARRTGDAHKVNTHLRHTGWYADNHEQMLYIGVVYQLAARDSEPRFISGYRCEDSGMHTFDLGATYSEAKDAAYAADDMAKFEAQEARDFYAQEDAKRDIEEAREQIHTINGEALALIREVKGNKYTPAVCSAIKGQISEFLADRREQFNIISEREADYRSAVPGG